MEEKVKRLAEIAAEIMEDVREGDDSLDGILNGMPGGKAKKDIMGLASVIHDCIGSEW